LKIAGSSSLLNDLMKRSEANSRLGSSAGNRLGTRVRFAQEIGFEARTLLDAGIAADRLAWDGSQRHVRGGQAPVPQHKQKTYRAAVSSS
jgi:hypothetical protein